MEYNSYIKINQWRTQNNKYWIEATSFSNWNPSDYLSNFRYSSRSLCATWDSATGFWAVEDCSERHLFLCEKEAECIQGRFGQKCSRTCHCYGEQCSGKDGICKYGCQKRWMGSSCDIHKVRATALYYCLKSSTHGNELIIRADQRGIDYQQVLAVDKNGDPVTTCNKSTFTKQGYKLQLTIRRKTSDSEDYRPDCGAQH
ncbi:uncharacterized protein LOC121366807, partial [Gigantopelta aegis]|uniref:uncharacterized protein LOC121366807 n=1 Tax=Gigantopelta aegis TaxID=1735272 RepID=UPI001B88E231